jgi:membrane-associated phospholipid phosphatase
METEEPKTAQRAVVLPSDIDGAVPAGRLRWQAFRWMALLSITFSAGYQFAGWAAGLHAHVGSIYFAWEQGIPFLPWTIVPYWTIDPLFCLAFFICTDAAELKCHVRRVLTAQVLAIACFLVFPLTLAIAKPATEGLTGFLFSALAVFDRPYNQAPSLHIALLVILWELYARHLSRYLRPVLHAWALLVGVSVLTTYQHHFIDVPTGALLGVLCLWIWPLNRPSPLATDAGHDR